VSIGTLIHTRVVDSRITLLADEIVTAYEPSTRFGTALADRRDQEGIYDLTPGDAGTEIAFTWHGVLTLAQALLGGSLRRGAMVRRMKARRDGAMRRIKEILETEPGVTV